MKVTRFEVINHAQGKGRELILKFDSPVTIEICKQDDGKTCKVFIERNINGERK